MNKAIKIGGTFAVVMATAFTLSSAMAYQGNPAQEGPDCSPERHAAMTEAMENNDYEMWSELIVGRGRVAKVISEENFAQFVKARRLGEAEDIAGADAIRRELGLRTSGGEKVGAGYGGGQGKIEGDKQGRGKMSDENRGQNKGGKFTDANGDGNCDSL